MGWFAVTEELDEIEMSRLGVIELYLHIHIMPCPILACPADLFTHFSYGTDLQLGWVGLLYCRGRSADDISPYSLQIMWFINVYL